MQSLYADVGLTLGKYVLEKYRPDLQGHAVDVQSMEVDKPLILKAGGESLFRAEMKYDMKTTSAQIKIFSVDFQGKTTMRHAKCVLRFDDPQQWLQEWQKNHYLIQRSIEWLDNRVSEGLASRMSRPMIYKLFSSLVDYNDEYKGLQEAILSNGDYEATAKVKFQAAKGDFNYNPMWIDSFGQLAGFLMNGHESTTSDQVFVNHGWKSLKYAKELCADTVYRTYIRMSRGEGTKYSGDVYIMDGNTIIAVYGGITVSDICVPCLKETTNHVMI
jgi:naphtho-gamma-pyrone polyketide synthase